MNSAHDLGFPSRPEPSSTYSRPTPLASWYTPGHTDGLGDRLLMFDNTAAASLELLRFRPELAAVPGFERALRDRVAELTRFRHQSFASVRAVERLDGDEGLALVSVHTAGKRLSELIQSPQRREAIHPAFAVWLIRELTPALADLHAQHHAVAHGALAPDRIVLTPDGRLVILEHVLGAALDRLRLSPRRFWHELGIVTTPDRHGLASLNGRNDVVQLGLVALSFAVGRHITPAEYPHRLRSLLEEVSQGAGRRAPALASHLRPWLDRALAADERGFRSAIEAHDAISDLPAPLGLPLLDDFQSPRRRRSIALSRETPMNDTAPEELVESFTLSETPARHSGAVAEQILDYPDPEPFMPGPTERVGYKDLPRRQPKVRRRVITAGRMAAAFALVAVVEGVMIERLLAGRYGAVSRGSSLIIESPAPGDAVMIDGRHIGVTPVQFSVAAPVHSIRVLTTASRGQGLALAGLATEPVASTATKGDGPATQRDTRGADVDAARALSAAAVRQRSGGVRLSSPIELHVFEGDRILGSSADGPIVASAGVHQFDLVNNTVGYRARQSVEIKAGQIVSLTIQPPDGRVSINASPWAQVWIDGNPAGETPLANVAVALGEHEITFRHPQLGERRVTAVVKSGATTRVSATLGQ